MQISKSFFFLSGDLFMYFRSGFTSPAKKYLKIRLIMKESSGIARYVHNPFKNSV